MGTRNLIAVFYRGRFVVAQYCQWDGYPEGQGWDLIKFLMIPENVERLIKGLDCVKILQESDLKYLDALHDTDCKCDNCFSKRWPSLNRDTGAKILALIADATPQAAVPVQHELEFVNDILFCEWAYCVDMDKRVLEVYGSIACRKSDVPKDHRFINVGEDDLYIPALLGTYSIANLPKDRTGFANEIYQAYDVKKKENAAKKKEQEQVVDDENGESEHEGDEKEGSQHVKNGKSIVDKNKPTPNKYFQVEIDKVKNEMTVVLPTWFTTGGKDKNDGDSSLGNGHDIDVPTEKLSKLTTTEEADGKSS